MNKEEFLIALRERLEIFPQEDIEEYINYYREMIEDHVEDGFPEEKVIETLGSVDEVFAVILQETAITKLLREKMKPKRKLTQREIWLLSLGFPIWLPLAITALALAITAFVLIWTLYVVLWSLVITLFAVELTFALGAIAGAMVSIPLLISYGNGFAAGVMFSGALVCAGLALILFRPCILSAKGSVKLAKKIWLGIKFLIVRKEKRT